MMTNSGKLDFMIDESWEKIESYAQDKIYKKGSLICIIKGNLILYLTSLLILHIINIYFTIYLLSINRYFFIFILNTISFYVTFHYIIHHVSIRKIYIDIDKKDIFFLYFSGKQIILRLENLSEINFLIKKYFFFNRFFYKIEIKSVKFKYLIISDIVSRSGAEDVVAFFEKLFFRH